MVFLYMAPVEVQTACGGTQAEGVGLSQGPEASPKFPRPRHAYLRIILICVKLVPSQKSECRMSPQQQHEIEEHELPCIEAILAGTLALMTGYSQALQAELHPRQRVPMGAKIGDNLALLLQHPQLSLGFRQMLLGLHGRWRAMDACTRDAAGEFEAADAFPTHARLSAAERLQ
ncbi:MAG: hypothetical protein ABI887_04930 [Burkholderiales bacterium]